MRNLITRILIFVGCMCFLSACITYEDVELIGIEKVRFLEVNKSSIKIEATVKIENPNTYKIKVVDSDLDLFLGGKEAGKAKITDRIVLPKQSNQSYTFVIEAEPKNLAAVAGSSIFSIFTTRKIDFEAKGSIKARALGVGKRFPVEFKDKIRLPKGGF